MKVTLRSFEVPGSHPHLAPSNNILFVDNN